MYLVSADVGSLAVKGAVQEVVRQMGHVDVLVNCAGTFHTAPLHETPPEKYEVRWTQLALALTPLLSFPPACTH